MGARELLHELTDAGFVVEAPADKLVIRPASKLTYDLRMALRAAPKTATDMSGRPYRITAAETDAAHAKPWDDAAIGRFVVRVSLFLRRGVNATDADDLAERLHLRDERGDDRVQCVECRHLASRASTWRCGNHRAAGVGRELPPELVTTMQRCPGFKAQ